ncbi:unnamed protein product [Dibothriocephalus latus]|uniref:Major facilitator superfamily associated domain-containing protein n=1 Tax=Dibothriocephalus latus TaxID=60516 RepID=A0A3P7L1J5_DIBLA|nr:unnamed protein product [Dibothriocephalus latus]
MIRRDSAYDEAEGKELFEDAVDDQGYNTTAAEVCYSVATISNSDEPLPLWRKLAYAAGGLPMQLTQNIISFFLPLFLLETAKITPYYLSAIQFAARISDAVTDPFVGYLVLRTKTRMGSKRPWIIFSTPISVICFFLLFYTVPWHSEFAKFMFYMTCVVVLQVGLTSFHVPYSSMVIVLSDIPQERDTLTAYRKPSFLTLGKLFFLRPKDRFHFYLCDVISFIFLMHTFEKPILLPGRNIPLWFCQLCRLTSF